MAGDEEESRYTTSSNGDETWGTLELLLLACAVNRHGSNSWDYISKELQKRTCSRNRNNHTNNDDDISLNIFTPLNCRQKYRHMKRRFSVNNSGDGEGLAAGDTDGAVAVDGGDSVGGLDELSCIVDELRRLRIEELKREVQRHDASIVSLQLKVKRLEEEREKSSKSGNTGAAAAADLSIQTHGNGKGTVTGTGTRGERGEQEKTSPPPDEDGGGADEAEAEGRSFNESNSTGHRDENRRATTEEDEEREWKRGPHGDGPEEPDRVQSENNVKPDKECSVRTQLGDNEGMEAETSESNELKDSVSESKRDVRVVAKQSSDVQSSASLSRRRRRGWRGGGGRSSGDEHTVEEVSPANGRLGGQSEPLIRFLEKLRSLKHGSVFDRRLPSQETDKYRNMILQHMDLGTVQSKLDKGIYRGSHLTFYRDLLLVFTNAVQFYTKSSAEHIAARELRKLVKQEINHKTWKPKPEPEIQLLDPAVKKPRTATAMIISRRRAPTPPKDEEEKTGGGVPEEKSHAPPRKAVKNGVNETDRSWIPVPKKLIRQNSALGNIDSNVVNDNTNKKNKDGKQEDQRINDSGGGRRREPGGKKENKQEKPVAATGKTKQGVANFLRRMKQNSPSREEADNGSADGGGAGGKEKERDEEKRTVKKKNDEPGVNGNRKGSAKEEEVVVVVRRRTSGRRQGIIDKEQEKDSVGRRRVGRPPTRKTAIDPPPLAAAGKRKREVGSGGSAGREK